jgi:hypothetical protein
MSFSISSLHAKKRLRASQFMTCGTGLLCLLICYCPDMGLMAVLAFHARVLNMELVLADRHDVLMAGQAVAPVRPRGFVRLVAFIAVELHGPVLRPVDLDGLVDRLFIGLEMGCIDRLVGQELFPVFFSAMAVQALLDARLQVLGPVGMAVEARKLLHARSVHFAVLVARQAEPFLKAELMGPVAVAFGAFDLFHEHMFCMVPRTGDARRVRFFRVLFPMAAEAGLPGHDHFSMPGRDLVVAEHGKGEDLFHLVELGGMVALMAVHSMMHAFRPCHVRFIMHMAGAACLGIVLEIIVDQVGGNKGPDREQDQNCEDDDPGPA